MSVDAFRQKILQTFAPKYPWITTAWKFLAKDEKAFLLSGSLITKAEVSVYLKMNSILPIEKAIESLSIANKDELQIPDIKNLFKRKITDSIESIKDKIFIG